MKVFRVLTVGCLLVITAAPVAARDRQVFGFADFTITPTMSEAGPPVRVAFLAQATTTYGGDSQNYPVGFWLSVFNASFTTWTGYQLFDYRDAPGSPIFNASFSFTLPNATEDWYYWGSVTYRSYLAWYYTQDWGGPLQFRDRGIPAVSTWGLALLGMLVAVVGVLVLRRG